LFSPSIKEEKPQHRVEVEKNLDASKDNHQKATNPITTPRKQKPRNAKILGGISSHVDSRSLPTSHMKCRQDDEPTDVTSSVNATKTTRSVQLEKIEKISTSIPSNTTRKTPSLNKRAYTTVPHVSKASLPLSHFTKLMGNTTCPTTLSSNSSSLSSSPIVKRKRDENVPTMTSSSTVTATNVESVSSISSRLTKRRSMTSQSTEEKLAAGQIIESCTPLTHDVCKVKTQRGRKTRRPQYYVPPETLAKRKRKKQEASASNSQSTAPLSIADSKQRQGTSQEGTKRNVSHDAISLDDANKVQTTVYRSKPTEIISNSTLRPHLDKQSRGNVTAKCWPCIGSTDNVERVSEISLDKNITTSIVVKKTPSKRLSHGSVLERLFAT